MQKQQDSNRRSWRPCKSSHRSFKALPMRLCIAFVFPRFVSIGFKLMGIARALFEKKHPTTRLSVMHGAPLLLLRQRQVRFGAVLGSSISHFFSVFGTQLYRRAEYISSSFCELLKRARVNANRINSIAIGLSRARLCAFGSKRRWRTMIDDSIGKASSW